MPVPTFRVEQHNGRLRRGPPNRKKKGKGDDPCNGYGCRTRPYRARKPKPQWQPTGLDQLPPRDEQYERDLEAQRLEAQRDLNEANRAVRKLAEDEKRAEQMETEESAKRKADEDAAVEKRKTRRRRILKGALAAGAAAATIGAAVWAGKSDSDSARRIRERANAALEALRERMGRDDDDDAAGGGDAEDPAAGWVMVPDAPQPEGLPRMGQVRVEGVDYDIGPARPGQPMGDYGIPQVVSLRRRGGGRGGGAAGGRARPAINIRQFPVADAGEPASPDPEVFMGPVGLRERRANAAVAGPTPRGGVSPRSAARLEAGMMYDDDDDATPFLQEFGTPTGSPAGSPTPVRRGTPREPLARLPPRSGTPRPTRRRRPADADDEEGGGFIDDRTVRRLKLAVRAAEQKKPNASRRLDKIKNDLLRQVLGKGNKVEQASRYIASLSA